MATAARSAGSDANKAFDTLIVGNGALGLALAFELANRGQQVALVGPAQRDLAASSAAGAMNGCFGEVTGDLLSSPYGRTKLGLDIEATALWDEWVAQIASIADLSVASLRRGGGTTVILNAIGTKAIDSINFKAIQQALDEHEAPYSMLDEHEIGWVSPQASSRPFKAIHIPGEHSINTPNYLAAVEVAVGRAGGR